MIFNPPLIKGVLVKRYKRFLSDVILEDQKEQITAYVPNTGSLISCLAENAPIYVSYHPDKERKLPYTLEMINMGKSWVGINTGLANDLVEEALKLKVIKNLPYPLTIKREVTALKSRFDFYLEGAKEEIYLEVKNVTYKNDQIKDLVQFPDSVTARGVKHLEDLITLKQQGKRAIIFYLVQREDVKQFSPAKHIDEKYAQTLTKAVKAGVEIMVYQTKIDHQEITITKELPWTLDL